MSGSRVIMRLAIPPHVSPRGDPRKIRRIFVLGVESASALGTPIAPARQHVSGARQIQAGCFFGAPFRPDSGSSMRHGY
jgi:hypothetical protein